MITVEANGARIPALGLGTWRLRDQNCADMVEHALKTGYRHLDTAAMYENEEAVGAGLRASGVPRDDVFLTTKVWYPDCTEGALQRSAEASLKRLGVEQVDLLLIHWPNPETTLEDQVGALCSAKKNGISKHIGVSNFPSQMLRDAVEIADECAAGSPEAIQLTKRIIFETAGEELATQLAAGSAMSATIRTTENAREGMQAFLEGRPPEWK